MNAFMRKEFRESVRWLPLGWLLMIGLLWVRVPRFDQMDKVPQLDSELFFYTAVGSAFIALGLSIAQFALDQRSAARAFLFHRGLSPTQLFQGKLLIGLGIYSLAVGVPLLVCTIYLESIGPLRLPTSARQTIPAWLASVFCFAFYLSGCMVMCSSARWIGTRVLPLGAASLVAFASGGVLTGGLWWVGAFLTIGIFGLFVLGHASHDAFLNANQRVAPSHNQRNNKYRSAVLIGASILTSIVAIFLPSIMSQSRSYDRYVQTGIDDSGQPWFVLSLRGHAFQRAKMAKEKNALIEDVTESWSTSEIGPNYNYMRETLGWSSTPFWSGREFGSIRSELGYVDPNGFVLVYKSVPPVGPGQNSSWILSYVVGQDRVSRVGESRGLPFASYPSGVLSFDSKTIVTKDGVFRFNAETGEVVQAVRLAIKAFVTLEAKTNGNLILYGTDKLFAYRKDANQGALSKGLELEATIDVGPDSFGSLGATQFWYKDKDQFTAITYAVPSKANPSPYQVVQKRPGQDLEVFPASIPEGMNGDGFGPPLLERILAGLAVPALAYAFGAVCVLVALYFFEVPWPGEADGFEIVAVIAVIQIILSCFLAYTAARHRGLSKRSRIGWSIAGASLGFGIGIAIMSIYQRCIREKCVRCGKLRRVELAACEHCENGWEPTPNEGIEIVDVDTKHPQLSSSVHVFV